MFSINCNATTTIDKPNDLTDTWCVNNELKLVCLNNVFYIAYGIGCKHGTMTMYIDPVTLKPQNCSDKINTTK